jgi:ABC-type arginine transport system permease subunit
LGAETEAPLAVRALTCHSTRISIYFGFSMGGFGLSGFASGLLALCMQNGGYVAEIYRGGLQSVSLRQYEAGRALGMRRWTLYTTVILPQVVARIIPPMTNQSISVIKDTSQVATGISNPFPSSGQSVSRGIFPSYVEKPGFPGGCAGRSR